MTEINKGEWNVWKTIEAESSNARMEIANEIRMGVSSKELTVLHADASVDSKRLVVATRGAVEGRCHVPGMVAFELFPNCRMLRHTGLDANRAVISGLRDTPVVSCLSMDFAASVARHEAESRDALSTFLKGLE